MEMKFCQSCGMPLTDEVLGTNADGSKNEEYCIYCYKDGAFTGDGCAISQASVDIMLGMVVGKTAEEARVLADRFIRMIKGTATEEEIESLGDAAALRDISHMPARVKCAVLGWHTMDEILKNLPEEEQ